MTLVILIVLKKTRVAYTFSIKMRKNRWRVLFEHENGELYQLDVIDRIYDSLKEIKEEIKH
jgi:hypothetical protein